MHGHDQYRCNDVSGMMNDQGGRSHFFTSAKGEQCESIGHSGFDRERGRQTARAALHSLGQRQGSVNFQGVSIYIDIYVHVCRSVY